MKLWIWAGLLLTLPSACGVDRLESERDQDDLLEAGAAECRKTNSTGCLQGQVPAAPNLVVQGEKFFDANALAAGFKSLLPAMESKNGVMLKADQVELKWITKFDNDSFSDGFHIYLKGASARDQRVMSNGSFAVNRLQAGYYEVRVQKDFKFALSEVQAEAQPGTVDEENQEAEDPAKPQAEDVRVASYCATLYAEDSFEIRRGYRTGTVVFDHFDVELTSCGSSDEENKITLN